MTKDKALKLAMEFVASISPAFICEATHHKKNEEHASNEPCPHVKKQKQTYEAIKEALAQPEQEPAAHSVIAGALFDFMGWLTSRKERIVLSSADDASPAVEVITEFAKMRGLSLEDAKVQDWNTTPPQRTWVGLTDEEVMEIAFNFDVPSLVARTAEAKLKEKNT